MDYESFVASKVPLAAKRGMSTIPALSSHLFDFQKHCVEFALGVGSSGLFLDTGLGKTLVQLEYSEHARQATNGKALILTPLAVAKQIEREGKKFGYDARVIRDQSEAREGINICNYDRMHLLEPAEFGTVTLDEASILKSFGGKTSKSLIDSFAHHIWRMPATATPAPNDHMEMGQYADFCGIMHSNEMLSRFFINDTAEASQKWRLKKFGVEAFWDWVASWCRLAQMPSDLGGDDHGFDLPPIEIIRHRAAEAAPSIKGGLFGDDSLNATNVFSVKRSTESNRVAIAVKIIADSIADGRTSWNLERKSGMPTHLIKLSARRQENEPNTLTPNPPIESPSLKGGLPPEPTRCEQSSEPNSTCSTSSGYASKTTTQCSTSKTEPAQSVDHGNQAEWVNSTSITITRPEPSEDCSATTAMLPLDSSEKIQKTLSARSTTSGIQTPHSWLLWCDTNSEQALIASALKENFGPNSFYSVSGSDSTEDKEEWIYAWTQGARPIMVSKASVLGYGLNFQHCHRCIFIGRTFSYESWYQAVRRLWRFGQKSVVQVHLVVAEGEDSIARVIDRKADGHDEMKTAMRAAMRRNDGKSSATRVAYEPKVKGKLPSWIV